MYHAGGLQGSVKTTAAAKLAKQLRQKGERVMLVRLISTVRSYQAASNFGERIDVPFAQC
jgi:signal recognition particle GTPase